MSDNGSDDDSSGFGDFCGYNLEEDLSEDELLDDELERPGKTYEYVNFVDPKYAEKRRSKSKSSSFHPSSMSSHSSTSSTRSIPHHSADTDEKDPLHHEPSESNKSQSFLNTQVAYHCTSNPSASRLISPVPSPHIIPEDEENNPDYRYTNHDHDISDYNHCPLTRTNTESEIAAEHGSVRTSIYLNDGRRQLINYRRNQRRHVWKDAELFDIICVIASPCVKPNNHPILQVPSLNRLVQSQSNQYTPHTAVPDTHTEAFSIDMDNGVFACVDDEKQSKKRRQTVLTTKRQKRNMKKKKQSTKKKRNRTANKRAKNGMTPTTRQIHAASDTELMRKTSHNSDSSTPQPMSRNRSTSSNDDRDILQHFDIKGLQTFMYDGILCSIHQTTRFLTLCGNIRNITTQIKGCKLLHYIGHAANGKLLLESNNDVGLGQWFDPIMATETPIIDKMTQCVVIESPTHMEVAQIFLELKVKHVIAIKQGEHDNFAHTRFLTQFYFALIESNTTIARAFRSALSLFEGLKYMDSIIADFRLLPEDEDHELILFRNGLFDGGKPVNYSHKLPPQNNLHAIRPFLGRWNDVYKVMNMIRDKKLAIVCSRNEGCGRTSTIVMAARYLWERGKFQGGVLHVKNNFNSTKIKNLADLILHTLFVSGVDGFEAIADFYNDEQDTYSNKSQLAVELLYEYVFRNEDHSTPVCLLFSDFDEIPFPPASKYAFVCALMERFDEEIEMPGDIGTRVVITCRVSMVSQLQYFMDHVFTSYAQVHHDPFTDLLYGGAHGSKSEVCDYSKLPMQYKRGHQVIKPLHEDDLIELFLQMIHIASTETLVYKFHQIKGHKALLNLFDRQPFKVKQISEYVLQTFDDNLSRQQFQYEEFEEADYGLVYHLEEDDTDLESDTEDEEEEHQQLSLKPYVTSINTMNAAAHQFTSTLELKMDPFSDYNPSPISKSGEGNKRLSAESTDVPQMPDFKSIPRLRGGISADLSNTRIRRSKLVKVISIKATKLQLQRSSIEQALAPQDTPLPVTPANTPEIADKEADNTANRSYQDLIQNDRDSLSVVGTAPFVTDTSVPVPAAAKALALSLSADYESMDLGTVLPTIHSVRGTTSIDIPKDEDVMTTGKSYQFLPVTSSHLLAPSLTPTAPAVTTVNHDAMQSMQSMRSSVQSMRASMQSTIQHATPSRPDVLLESTIVPSDDCHILLTKSTSTAITLSSRNICVDMAITPMDYKRTFIRQKIDYLFHHKPGKLGANKSVDLYQGDFPNTNSFSQLPVITSPGHKIKNASFGYRSSTTTGHDIPSISKTYEIDESTRLKLKLTGESIPIAKRHSRGATPELDQIETTEEEEEEEDIDDKIKQAWPTLDDIVSGFTKLEEERKSRKEMDYRKSLVFTHANAYGTPGFALIQPQLQPQLQPQHPIPVHPQQHNIAHIPREHQQRRFKHMDTVHEARNSPIAAHTKPLNINIQQPPTSINQPQQKQRMNIMPPLSGMIHPAASYETEKDSDLTMSLNQSNTRPHVIQDAIAHQIWNDNGGDENGTLGLEDLIMDFYNYFTTKTSNQYLRIDEQSFGPLLKQFDETLQLTAAVFNNVWKWFDALCDIVNETKTFWNNKFASNHGFITGENAEKALIKSAPGTFIIRFTAPEPDVIVTFNDPNKQYSNHPITHITFVRTNNSDLYENVAQNNNHEKEKLKVWIQKMSQFRYIYNKDHFTKKGDYFW